MPSFLIFLFWGISLVIFYTYAGYPVLIWFLGRFFKKKIIKGNFRPSVSVILSVFNEEKNIEAKLLNLLNLDYPEEKLEILIGSDGGSDTTNEIISKFQSERIRFFPFVDNLGKPHVLNALVQEARGTILVFTDARQEFRRNSIKELMDNFHDANVGCVSGELHFADVDEKSVGKGMDLYWRYEKFLRKCESDFASTLGATGAIYAVRRRLFAPFPTEILVDDMYLPLLVVEKGYRAVFDSRAWAFDRASKAGKEEFKRKVRTLAGNYQIFQHFPNLFNPFRSPIAWQFFSHKFLRLVIPFCLCGVLITNLFLLSMPFYRLIFVAQILFYTLAFAEALRQSRHSKSAAKFKSQGKGIGYIPYIFCLLNYSAFMALVHYLNKKQKVTWGKAYA